jgi:hypothetical protein
METLRTLAADRDQAFARIAAIERSLDSITGSIKRTQPQNGQSATQAQPPQTGLAAPQPPAQAAAAPAAMAGPPQEQPAAPLPRPPIQVAVTSEQVTYPQRPQAAAAPPMAADTTRSPAPDSANRLAAIAPPPPRSTPPAEPPTTGLGLDVGGAINYEGLRTLWHSTKTGDVPISDELYPLVAVRENSRTHGIDLRLVVGPFDDMEVASRLCAALSAAHRYCQPVAFEGQRLTVNELPVAKLVPVHHPAPPKPDPAKQPDAKPAANPFFSLPK